MEQEKVKLYDGDVEITEVIPENLDKYQENGLSEDEVSSSFNIVFKTKDKDGNEYTVKLEVSPREGVGKAAGKRQIDMTYSTLVSQRIIASAGPDATEADKLTRIAELFGATDVVGKTVSIYQREGKVRDDGTHFVNTYFSNGPRRLAQNEIAARIARLTGKPVTPAAADNNDDMPF